MTPPIPFAARTPAEHEATARILAAIANYVDVPGTIAAELRAAREAERGRDTTPDALAWGDFLAARLNVLRWMRAEGKTPEQMAAVVSADVAQVTSILDATDAFASNPLSAGHDPVAAERARGVAIVEEWDMTEARGEGGAELLRRLRDPSTKVDEEDAPAMVECPACKRPDGAVNHVPGAIFVGYGIGWQTCPGCDGTQRVAAKPEGGQ